MTIKHLFPLDTTVLREDRCPVGCSIYYLLLALAMMHQVLGGNMKGKFCSEREKKKERNLFGLILIGIRGRWNEDGVLQEVAKGPETCRS